MKQDAALIKAIFMTDQNSQLITALIDIEIFAVPKLAPSKELIEKEPQLILLVKRIG